MAMINCPECKKRVSDTATACPHCGAPITGAREGTAAGAPLTTVQETSKKFKLQILLAALAFWGGLVFLFQGNDTAEGAANIWPMIAMLFGLIWYIATKFRVWWHHK